METTVRSTVGASEYLMVCPCCLLNDEGGDETKLSVV